MDSVRLTDIWLLATLACVAITVVMLPTGLQLTVNYDDVPFLVFACTCLLLHARLSTVHPPLLTRSILALNGVALFALISYVGAVASYVAASQSTGFVDGAFSAFDAAIGFDWRASYDWEAHHPLVTAVLRAAYCSIGYTPMVIIVALAMTGRIVMLRRFLITFAIVLLLSVGIFPFVPMQSAIVHDLGRNPTGYMPFTDVFHVSVIEGLRNGTITRVALGRMIGLIGFPSVHAASALLYTWAAWPVRALRVPALMINVVMLAATPVEGAHYMADVLGGLAAATIAILFAEVRVPARHDRARFGRVRWLSARTAPRITSCP